MYLFVLVPFKMQALGTEQSVPQAIIAAERNKDESGRAAGIAKSVRNKNNHMDGVAPILSCFQGNCPTISTRGEVNIHIRDFLTAEVQQIPDFFETRDWKRALVEMKKDYGWPRKE
jgi:hypothetical protein